MVIAKIPTVCLFSRPVKGLDLSARVAELVDALDSGSSTRKGVQVRVLSRAPFHFQWVMWVTLTS